MKKLFTLLVAVLFCLSAQATLVTFSFTNSSTGQLDTNDFKIIPLGHIRNFDGTFNNPGLPVRVSNPTGVATNLLVAQYYQVTNQFIGNGFLIRIPDASLNVVPAGDSSIYCGSANPFIELTGPIVTTNTVQLTNAVTILSTNFNYVTNFTWLTNTTTVLHTNVTLATNSTITFQTNLTYATNFSYVTNLTTILSTNHVNLTNAITTLQTNLAYVTNSYVVNFTNFTLLTNSTLVLQTNVVNFTNAVTTLSTNFNYITNVTISLVTNQYYTTNVFNTTNTTLLTNSTITFQTNVVNGTVAAGSNTIVSLSGTVTTISAAVSHGEVSGATNNAGIVRTDNPRFLMALTNLASFDPYGIAQNSTNPIPGWITTASNGNAAATATVAAQLSGTNISLVALINTESNVNATAISAVQTFATGVSNSTVASINGSVTSLTIASNLNLTSSYNFISNSSSIIGVENTGFGADCTMLQISSTTWTNSGTGWALVTNGATANFLSNNVAWESVSGGPFSSGWSPVGLGPVSSMRTHAGAIMDNNGIYVSGKSLNPGLVSQIAYQILTSNANFVIPNDGRVLNFTNPASTFAGSVNLATNGPDLTPVVTVTTLPGLMATGSVQSATVAGSAGQVTVQGVNAFSAVPSYTLTPIWANTNTFVYFFGVASNLTTVLGAGQSPVFGYVSPTCWTNGTGDGYIKYGFYYYITNSAYPTTSSYQAQRFLAFGPPSAPFCETNPPGKWYYNGSTGNQVSGVYCSYPTNGFSATNWNPSVFVPSFPIPRTNLPSPGFRQYNLMLDYGATNDGVSLWGVQTTAGSSNVTLSVQGGGMGFFPGGSTAEGTFQTTSVPFQPTDVGKTIMIYGVGSDNSNCFTTTITNYLSGTSVQIAGLPAISNTNTTGVYGTPNDAAIQGALNTVSNFSADIFVPSGIYLITGAPSGTNNSQLIIPPVKPDGANYFWTGTVGHTLTLRGVVRPKILQAYLDPRPTQVNIASATFWSTCTNLKGGSVLDCQNFATPIYNNFCNSPRVEVERMQWIGAWDNNGTILNLGSASSCKVAESIISSGYTLYNTPFTHHTNSFGVILPTASTSGELNFEGNEIIGFDSGITGGEHVSATVASTYGGCRIAINYQWTTTNGFGSGGHLGFWFCDFVDCQVYVYTADKIVGLYIISTSENQVGGYYPVTNVWQNSNGTYGMMFNQQTSGASFDPHHWPGSDVRFEDTAYQTGTTNNYIRAGVGTFGAVQFSGLTGPTNAGTPGNGATPAAWLNYTNSTGGVFKMPLYQ